jgi:hypothetical protein
MLEDDYLPLNKALRRFRTPGAAFVARRRKERRAVDALKAEFAPGGLLHSDFAIHQCACFSAGSVTARAW